MPLNPTEVVECPACEAPNPADRRYCRHCFADLKGEEETAPDESLVSPYVPPSASPDEFRGRSYPIRPFPRPEVAPDDVDLDATLGELATHDERAWGEADRPFDAEPSDEPPVAPDAAAPTPPEAEPAPDRPAELPAVIPARDAPSEQEPGGPPWQIVPDAPLDNVDDPIPMPPIIATPHRSIPTIERPPTARERADAHLFHQIAVEPAPLHAQILRLQPPRPEILSRAGRLILYMLVLVAALIPIFTGGQTAAWVQPRNSVRQLASDLSALPDGSVVLVAFEYSPSFAGELNPLAITVLRHIAAQAVPIVAMSTRPEGVGLAEQVLEAVVEATPDYTYGQDYVILGYLAGQEAGLRTLAHSMADAFVVDHVLGERLDQFPPTQGLATIQDATQILLLADDDMSVRRWIEQLGSRYRGQRSPLRFQALVTARIEPMLVTYAEAGQLETVIAGTYGAPQYAMAIGADTGGVGSNTDGFAALFGLVLLVCLATNVLYAVRGETPPASDVAHDVRDSTRRGKRR
jgi:hypothetical protein